MEERMLHYDYPELHDNRVEFMLTPIEDTRRGFEGFAGVMSAEDIDWILYAVLLYVSDRLTNDELSQ